MPQSSELIAPAKVLLTQYNELRKDVLDTTLGHTHSGTGEGGALVSTLNIDAGLLYTDTTNDRVGIGTTEPARKFEVRVTSAEGGTSARFTCTDDEARIELFSIDTCWVLRGGPGKFCIQDLSNNRFPFKIEINTPNDTLYLDSSGNVGIGTTSPEAGLDVATPDTGRQLKTHDWADLSSSASGYGLLGGNMYQDWSPPAFKYSSTHESIGAIGFAVNYPAWNKASVITSGTTSSTAGASFTPTAIVTFQYDGNVGIGTTSPDAVRLHIRGSGDESGLILDRAGVAVWKLFGEADGSFLIRDMVTTGNPCPVRIEQGTPSNTLCLASTGNIGIGTTSPDEKFTVKDGDVLFRRTDGTAAMLYLQRDTPGTGVILGAIDFTSGAYPPFCRIYGYTADATSGSEDGSIRFWGMSAGAGNLAFRFDMDGSGYADVGWYTFSPDVPEVASPKEYLRIALEDALKPKKPFAGLEASDEELEKYKKDISKIAIAIARYCEDVEERLKRIEKRLGISR